MFKIGDKVRATIKGGNGYAITCDGWEGVIKSVEGENIWVFGKDCPTKDGFEVNSKYFELIQDDVKPSWKKMNLKDYKKIAKVGDKLIITYSDINPNVVEGINGEMINNRFAFWQNYWEGSYISNLPKDYKYSHVINFQENNVSVELLTDKIFTKKRKAYVEITKEVGKVYISLKIPQEIEDFFKDTSEGKTQTSEAWFKKGVGIEFYKQPKELEQKLTEIDSYVYSDFGSGLMKNGKINVSILRSVGISKGIKIHSNGFSGLTNADLQSYVKRLGLYIKALWESNISTTKIKSVITFEL